MHAGGLDEKYEIALGAVSKKSLSHLRVRIRPADKARHRGILNVFRKERNTVGRDEDAAGCKNFFETVPNIANVNCCDFA